MNVRLLGQGGSQEGGGLGGLGLCHFFRGSLSYDGSTVGAGFRAEIEDEVGLGCEVHVMFDDDDGVAFIGKAVEHVDEPRYVLLVKTDRGFLDEVEVGLVRPDISGSWTAFDELRDQLQALGFAS